MLYLVRRWWHFGAVYAAFLLLVTLAKTHGPRVDVGTLIMGGFVLALSIMFATIADKGTQNTIDGPALASISTAILGPIFWFIAMSLITLIKHIF